jgi:hypothetical protein
MENNTYVHFYTKNTNAKEVIKVRIFNNNIDEADRKARTIATKLKKELAGGYFIPIPCNYDKLNIINCPDNTKIQPYNKKDLYIIALIEHEKNMEYEIF